jgi:hypothetical protein
MRSIVFSRTFCAGLGLFLLSSCGDPDVARRQVSGTVTYDGQPVPFGDIRFNPNSRKDNEGPQGSAEIIDGKFKTNPEFGPVFGPNVVIINAFSDPPPPKGEMPSMKYLVREYTTNVVIRRKGEVNIDIPKQ